MKGPNRMARTTVTVEDDDHDDDELDFDDEDDTDDEDIEDELDDDDDDDTGDDDDLETKSPEELLAEVRKLQRANRKMDRDRRRLIRNRRQDGDDDDTGDDEAKADRKLVRAEAKAQLAGAGLSTSKAKLAVGMLKLDGVEVDDDGDVDEEHVAELVADLVDEMPELFAADEPDDDDRKRSTRRRRAAEGSKRTPRRKGSKREATADEQLLATLTGDRSRR